MEVTVPLPLQYSEKFALYYSHFMNAPDGTSGKEPACLVQET